MIVKDCIHFNIYNSLDLPANVYMKMLLHSHGEFMATPSVPLVTRDGVYVVRLGLILAFGGESGKVRIPKLGYCKISAVAEVTPLIRPA